MGKIFELAAASLVFTFGCASNPAPHTGGGLDRKVIDEEIKSHVREIRACYEEQLKTKKFSARLASSFVIGATGKVTKAEIATSTVKNKKMEDCILGVIKELDFPPPKGGGRVEVKYPFAFSPSGESN